MWVVARLLERLNALQVRRLDAPGLHADGGGLYLQIMGDGGRSWIFRYRVPGRQRQMGLGPAHTVSLAQARAAARDARQLRIQGLDPIEERRKAEADQKLEQGSGVTFEDAVDAYIEANKAAWRNEKHVKQWKSTLTTYATPRIGKLPVGEVETRHVLAVLEPIWQSKTETASRVRGRIENVLDWATVYGHRAGDNPARWKGHLDKILPAKAKVAKVQHHAALPYPELPDFMKRLAKVQGVAARALEFAILTAARTSEVVGAVWSEIDLVKKVWTIPAERMKAERDHRVPLSAPAIAILEAMHVRWLEVDARRWRGRGAPEQPAEPTGPVFFGLRAGKGLSNMSLLKVLKGLKRSDLTTHGFRSTFSDWAHETTNYPGEMIEMALAHKVANKVEAAYRRGDMFAKRHALMNDWASAGALAD
ncbi:integrase [Caulobacter sp. Root1472]|nr:integrase [Caulobacter sp. Root1472]